MGPLGIPELVIIFVVALVVFGPRKLPELGRSLGKSLSEFKRASNELRSTLDDEIRLEDRRAAAKPAAAAAPLPVDPSPLDDGTYSDDTGYAGDPTYAGDATATQTATEAGAAPEPEPETVARGQRA